MTSCPSHPTGISVGFHAHVHIFIPRHHGRLIVRAFPPVVPVTPAKLKHVRDVTRTMIPPPSTRVVSLSLLRVAPHYTQPGPTLSDGPRTEPWGTRGPRQADVRVAVVIVG